MTKVTKLTMATMAAVLLAGVLPQVCTAQEYPEYQEGVAGPPVAAGDPVALLSEDQLDQLLGPIALYPDSLLAQVLPAATYPQDVATAAQWVAMHPDAGDEAIDARPWEPSVKAVAHYPTVLKMLSDNAEWAQAVGAAFLSQQQDVMASVQRLRRQAVDAENLQSTAEQQVVVDDDAIQILPSSPEVMYVPQYDPQLVYVRRVYEERQPPLFVFVRRPLGRWLDCSFDWHDHHIMVGSGWHNGWQYTDRSWRPVGRTVIVSRNDRFVRYSGAITRAPLLTRQWSRDNSRPRPIAPRPVIVRHDDPRVVRPIGPAVVHATPFSVPHPVVRTAETRRPTVPVGPLNVDRRANVDDAVRRGNDSRSAWTGRTPPTVTHTPPAITHTPPAVTHTPPVVTHTPPIVTSTPPTVTHTPPVVTHTPPTVTHTPPVVTHTPPVVTHTPPTVTSTPPTVTHTPPVVTHTPPTVTHTPPPTVTHTPPPTVTHTPPPTVTHTPPPTITKPPTDTPGKRFVPGATAGPSPSALGNDTSTRDTDAASKRGHRSLGG